MTYRITITQAEMCEIVADHLGASVLSKSFEVHEVTCPKSSEEFVVVVKDQEDE